MWNNTHKLNETESSMALKDALTSSEMRELDRKLMEIYHIDLPQMMENAGRALALQSKRFLGSSLIGRKILVMAGKGSNGGGGLVAARHLHNWGAAAEIVLSSPREEMSPVAMKQLRIIDAMGIPTTLPVGSSKTLDHVSADLILDALLGYSQVGNPRGEIARLINLANDSKVPIIALYIPTGLNPDTGNPNSPCIVAKQTVTLAAVVGELFLADISVPLELYRQIGENRVSFEHDQIIRIPDSA